MKNDAGISPISSNGSGSPGIAACPDCDLLYGDVTVLPGQKLRCPRCRTVLRSPVADSIGKMLALSLTGLLLYIPAMILPIMTITIVGLKGESSILESVIAMFETGFPFVGIMVFLTAILFSLIKLALLFIVAVCVKLNYTPRYLTVLFRIYKHLAEWGMLDVYLLGILVSIIKIHSMGELEFNLGFFCLTALCLVSVASSAVVDEHAFWRLFDEEKEVEQSFPVVSNHSTMTARQAGLMRCHDCALVVPAVKVRKDQAVRCPRCGASMHSRKPRSVSSTWALLICALVLFLPANLLPVMQVDFLGNPEITTIMDGVIYFFKSGEYVVGGIIFTASVLVPLFKIVGIALILLSIQYGWDGWLKHKAKMFRFVEFIGRWSFLDIFVIALLAATIQFGVLSSIVASPAARYFTAVVITTMLSAIVFDPRILWDSKVNVAEEKGEEDGGSNC
ncbi:MAG: paraquat-inducible protein A [Desulfopila sp.]|jgi:paraquat-inducible protein A|nr:paraquat-inducible protein A [Desulfopila sp.]